MYNMEAVSTFSEASDLDSVGICLQRALEKKVQRLCDLLNAEDLRLELDRVVCCLVKMAVRSAKRKRSLSSAHWLQCKMYDLLSLTERAVQHRQQYFIDTYPLPSDGNESTTTENSDIAQLIQIKENPTESIFLDKYNHLLHGSKDKSEDEYVYLDTESEAKSVSITVRTCEDILKDYSLMVLPTMSSEIQQTMVELNTAPSEESLKEFQRKIQNEPDLSNYNVTTNKFVSKANDGMKHRRSLNTNHKNKSDMRHIKVKTIKKRKRKAFRKVRNNNKNNALGKSTIAKHNFNNRNDILTNVSLQCSSNNLNMGDEFIQNNFSVVSKPMWINSNVLCTASVAKPIPLSLIQLSKMSINNTMTENSNTKEQVTELTEADVAKTKESLLIDIVMEDANETIALCRTIGTDVCNSVSQFENEIFEGCDNSELEITPSQTIFVFDINEPSTSKGIRHFNLDAQCGSDTAINVSVSNTLPDKRTENSRTNLKTRSNYLDFGTCTNNDNDFTNIITPRVTSKGIVIKDSLLELPTQEACLNFNTYTQEIPSNIIQTNAMVLQVSEQIPKENIIDFKNCINKDADYNIIDDCDSSKCEYQKVVSKEISMANICENIANVQNDKYEENCSITKLLKPVSSKIKVDDSVSEFCTSIGSSSKSPVFDDNSSLIVGVSTILRQSKQRLACGLVQLHSFKEKQTSEDVVYQGRWQERTNKMKNMSIANYKFGSASKKGMIFDKSKSKPSDKLQHKKSLHKLDSTRIKEHKFTRKCITIDIRKLDRKESLQKLKKSIVRKKSIHKLQRVCTPSNLPQKVVQNVQQDKTLTIPKNFIKINKNIFDKNLVNAKHYKNKSREPGDLLYPNTNLKSDDKDLKKELLKPTIDKLRAVTYVVLQNKPEKIDKKHISRHDLGHNTSDGNVKRNSCSSISVSSSCSSPNSVATVRVAPIRHHSLSPTKKYYPESEKRLQSHNSSSCSPCVTKHNKVDVDDSSGSNISYQENFNKSISNKLNKVQKANKDNKPLNNIDTSTPKSAFTGKSKRNIYVAKLPDHKTSNLIKSDNCALTTYKSVCKKLNISDNDEPAKVPVNNNLEVVQCKHNPPYSVKNNMIFNDLKVINRQIDIVSNKKQHIDKCGCSKVEEPPTDTPRISSTHSVAYVRGLIESRINVAVNTPAKTKENINPNLVQVNSSKISLISKNNPNVSSDCYLSSGSSKDISYKASLKSMSCCKQTSEHWLTETDLSNYETTTCNCSSFEDTAVRKYPVISHSSTDSYMVDSCVANLHDPVNIIDSETGSVVASDVTRQMAPDELNISSRSSESYQSCQLNDETVPNWLYEMIAEQESEEDQPGSRVSPMSVPTAESLFDRNGNLTENTVGAGAGAGDGRGVHSDYSHDSSGHGTSLSSSNTNVSSGRLSEALTLDPSSMTGTYELIRDSNGGSIRFHDDDEEASTSHFHDAEYGDDRDSSNCRLHREPLNRDLTLQSDFDADVSSLDTDVPDYSDN